MNITNILIISSIVSFVCTIIITGSIVKIKNVQCKPFQNKRPDYPNKVLELLQSIISMQQHQMQEFEKVRKELEVKNNDGVKPGMKKPDVAHHEEMVKIHKEQTEILKKILEATNGEEKKKMLEKWKQATDLINSEYKE